MGDCLDVLLAGEQSLCMLDPMIRDMVADGTTAAGAEAAGKLPH
jgi:hypothetical protein